MSAVEEAMVEFIRRRLAGGSLAVPEEDIMNAVVPADHPEDRYRSSYRHGLERLRRRHVVNCVRDSTGALHYFIGTHPSPELVESLP
jgi:hypothetical protein